MKQKTASRCASKPAAAWGVSRRRFLESIAAAVAAAGGTAATARPLNVVLILADDLGWADLACYGADLHETPHLDQLAREGVLFTDAYASSPVCSPTRASIMTGKYPARLHMTTWYESADDPPRDRKLVPPVTVGNLPNEEVTIAEALHKMGYLTAIVGKWHLGSAGYYPETQGFDINIGGTFWGAPQTYFYPYRGNRHYGGEFRYIPHLEFGEPGEYLTDRLATEALRIIDRARDVQLLLYLAHHTVHTPIEGKRELVEYYQARIRPGMHHRNAGYAAMVHSLDQNVGRVLHKLDERGIAGNTVVIFTSDNGGFVNAYENEPVTNNYPLRSGKGSLYEGGVRVPLIVRWPGVTPRAGVCRQPIMSVDFYPTIQEIAGLPSTAVDGRSIASLLRDPSSVVERSPMCSHYPHYYPTTSPVSAIRDGNWKLLEYYEDGHVELYDLAKDLSESRDLAADLPAVVDSLLPRLHQWLRSVDAQMPRPHLQHGL